MFWLWIEILNRNVLEEPWSTLLLRVIDILIDEIMKCDHLKERSRADKKKLPLEILNWEWRITRKLLSTTSIRCRMFTSRRYLSNKSCTKQPFSVTDNCQGTLQGNKWESVCPCWFVTGKLLKALKLKLDEKSWYKTPFGRKCLLSFKGPISLSRIWMPKFSKGCKFSHRIRYIYKLLSPDIGFLFFSIRLFF